MHSRLVVISAVTALVFVLVTAGLLLTGSPAAPGPLSIVGEHLTPSKPVTHVVLLSFKSTAQAADIKKVTDGMLQLQEKCIHPILEAPYILNIRGGANTAPSSLDSGVTHAFVLDFDSPEHRDYYLEHDPAHQEFREFVNPYLDMQIVSVDFQNGKYTTGWWRN